MKKRALRKSFYMEIRKSSGRFLSIFFIVAIGVAFFSGIRAAEPDMRYSGDAYFDEKNLHDIQIMSTLGLTEEDIEALRGVEGVSQVEAGYSLDALCTDNNSFQVFHILSILPTMNQFTVEEGRLPSTTEECAVDADFLSNSDYQIGDKISFTLASDEDITDRLSTGTYTITGTVSSPCYIGFHRGSTTIGNGTIAAFAAVLPESFQMEVYTEAYVAADGAKELTAFTDDYAERVGEVSAKIEEIQQEREEARYQSIVDEAKEELDKAQKELVDARDKAEEELAQAERELADGKAEIVDAEEKINASRAELEQARVRLISGQRELDTNRQTLESQSSTLAQRESELNGTKQQYQMLAESQMADAATLQAMAEQIAQGEAQIAAGKQQIEAAKAGLGAAQSEIDSGWTSYYRGAEEIEEGQKELDENRKKLEDGEKEYEQARQNAKEQLAEGEQKIEEAQKEIEEIEPPEWYINDRDDLSEYTGYGENADRMQAIGQVFPVLFFLVAALISLTTMTRMVEEQRTQIGTLKALGYSRRSIAGKYLGYAALATALGSVFGVLVGEKLFPYVIIVAYGIVYRHIHNVVIPYNMYYALLASVAALLCTLLATFFSCRRELREQAAQLMRPPAPKQGKRVLLERVPFLWNKLNFTWKSTIRNLIRYKKRFFMTIFGIAGCMALLLVGFGLEDSISDIGRLQYEELQLYAGTVILDPDASEAEQEEVCDALTADVRVAGVEKNLLKQVKAVHGDIKRELYLNVPENVDGFSRFVVNRDRVTKKVSFLNDEGAILSEKTAKMLGVGVGDTIFIEDGDQHTLELPIAAICENYLQHYLYITPALYETIYGKKPEYNSVFFLMKDEDREAAQEVGEAIIKKEGALSVSYTKDIARQIDEMIGALDIVILVLVIAAGLLAFVVLYNLNNINITERKRELATLKVLGFYPHEVTQYVYRENVILTILGALAGVAAGKMLHRFIIVTVEIETAMFGRNIDLSSFFYSFLITIGFSVFVNLVMYFKLKRIDMVESLKSVE